MIGVDSSDGMLEVCRDRAPRRPASIGCSTSGLGDLRDPPVDGARAARRLPLPRVPAPRRATPSAAPRSRAAYRLLLPGGRLVFDVFTPAPDDIAETNGRWLEREPGIWERADWDEEERRLTLTCRGTTSAPRR